MMSRESARSHSTFDKGAWEYLAYQLAFKAGIQMAESRIERIAGKYHTFFTKRFDRQNGERIHYASAMIMTGNSEDTIKENPAGYLDIAEFIQFNGAQNTFDLGQFQIHQWIQSFMRLKLL